MTGESADASPHECETPSAAGMPTVKFAIAAHLLDITALFQCGGFLIDSGRRILSLNRIAVASLGNGIIVKDKRLAATDPGSDARLQSAVELALNLNGGAEVSVTSIEINRIGHMPLLVRLLRLDQSLRPALSDAVLLLVIFDPEIRRAPQADMLMRLFDLTPVEAEVAIGIAGGKRAPEIATDRGVKIETVRTQSKAALAKTGMQNQVELTALLTRLAFFGSQQESALDKHMQ
jgi:DNA-binding CsgD family transcriptional regulator